MQAFLLMPLLSHCPLLASTCPLDLIVTIRGHYCTPCPLHGGSLGASAIPTLTLASQNDLIPSVLSALAVC